MKSVKKISLFLTLVLLTLNSIYAQVENSQVKNTIDVIYALKMASAVSDFSLIKRGAYIKDSLNSIMGQHVEFVFFGGLGFGNGFGDNTRSIYGVKVANNKILSGTIVSEDCQADWVNITWKNNKIVSTSDYDIKYDNMGRIINLNETGWYKTGKKWGRREFSIRYKNGLLYEISQAEETGEGKTSAEVTPVLLQPEYMKRVEYKSDTLIDVSVRKYAPKKKSSDPTVAQTGGRILIVNDGTSTRITKRSDGAVMGTSELKILKPGIKQLTTTILPRGWKTISVFEVNERNWVTHFTEKKYNPDGTLSSHSENKYTYQQTDQKSVKNRCGYKFEFLSQKFDLAGNVISESNTEGLTRKKLEDGTWGPWKQMQY